MENGLFSDVFPTNKRQDKVESRDDDSAKRQAIEEKSRKEPIYLEICQQNSFACSLSGVSSSQMVYATMTIHRTLSREPIEAESDY